MNIYKNIAAAVALSVSLLTFRACIRDEFGAVPPSEEARCIVGISVGSPQTRTVVNDDGRTVSWQEGDALSLWAADASGQYVLLGQRFDLFATDGSRAWFTSTLASEMSAADYSYYATSPVPESVSGTRVTFVLPSSQDGKASGGSDIMVSDPASGPALRPVPNPDDHSDLSLEMNHLTHLLRFYCPYEDERLGGENIQSIVMTMPKPVCGIISTDLTDPLSAVLTDGGEVIRIDLAEPLAVSDAVRRYAYASIFPNSFEPGENMELKLYTDTKAVTLRPIDLKARTMAAGHATSVALIPEAVSMLCRLRFTIGDNNLGEEIRTLTLTAPEGCVWPESQTNVLVHDIGAGPTAGHSFELFFEDEAAYRRLGSQHVTITYDSEHIRISESVTLPSLTSGYAANVGLNVPYLLFEDFSSVNSFSSNDAYSTSSSGNKSAVSFLEGWSGGRVGASEGYCVRLACRRETSSDYPSRMDSAPLKGEIKSPVNLKVSFDFGANNKFGGLAIITDGNVGQNCHIGYVTSADKFSSGSDAGTFEDANTFYVKEYTGDWNNTPNDYITVLHAVPASSPVRISWRTLIEHQVGTTNTTAWLYVDNVKVQVAD